MDSYPIKPTNHVRSYASGKRPIPEMLDKRDGPEAVVAETREVSDYGETTEGITVTLQAYVFTSFIPK